MYTLKILLLLGTNQSANIATVTMDVAHYILLLQTINELSKQISLLRKSHETLITNLNQSNLNMDNTQSFNVHQIQSNSASPLIFRSI